MKNANDQNFFNFVGAKTKGYTVFELVSLNVNWYLFYICLLFNQLCNAFTIKMLDNFSKI